MNSLGRGNAKGEGKNWTPRKHEDEGRVWEEKKKKVQNLNTVFNNVFYETFFAHIRVQLGCEHLPHEICRVMVLISDGNCCSFHSLGPALICMRGRGHCSSSSSSSSTAGFEGFGLR